MKTESERYYGKMRLFDAFAPIYNFTVLILGGVRGKVVDVAAAKKGSRILDVATGTGKQAFAFAKRGYGVVGVDLSDGMLAIAKRDNKYPNARFEAGDATHMHFRDSSFDVACISFGLHEMPPAIRGKALREMARVTKRGGTVIIVDYALPESGLRRRLFYNFVRLYEGGTYESMVKSDMKAALRKAGLEPLEEVTVLAGAAKIWKCRKK